MAKKQDPEKIVREIKRKTRRKFSSKEKIRIVPRVKTRCDPHARSRAWGL